MSEVQPRGGVRKGIQRLIDVLEDKLNNHERVLIIVELPTGYGKTTAAPHIYDLVKKYGVSDRVIHVLPLRAIIRKLLMDIVKVNGDGDCMFNTDTWVGEAFAKTGIKCDEIAYQMGDYVLGVRKEPLFDARYVITTIDSFIHNLFKIPITELYRDKRHYFIPYGRIYTSTVIFDEAHLALSDEEPKTVASLIASIRALLEVHVPVIVMTATLPPKYEDLLINEVAAHLQGLKPVVIRLDREDRESNESNRKVIRVHDEDFEKRFRDIRYKVHKIKYSDVLEKVKAEVNEGRRVLVVINDVDKVKEYYRRLVKELGDDNVAIIHSLLVRNDRERNEEALGKVDVLVGTSAIEAGVDVSFDTLITALDNPMSFVQRIGRICRGGQGSCKDGNGRIYLITDCKYNISEAIDYIDKNNVNWRIPYNIDDIKGYVEFLITTTQSKELELSSKHIRHMELLHEIFTSFVVNQETLEAAFEKVDFSFVRSPLIEVLVEKTALGKREDVIKNSFTIGLDDLMKNEFCNSLKKCILGVAYEVDAESDEEVKLEIAGISPEDICKKPLGWFRNFVKKHKASPLIIVRGKCYEDGVGFGG